MVIAQIDIPFLPHLAYDSVVFGFEDNQLKILLIEYHNTGLFALPGGFVKKDEDLNYAVKRGLKERTGLDQIFLEQFYTFGNANRHPSDTMATILKANDLDIQSHQWMLDRFVSVAYYALIRIEQVSLSPDTLLDSCAWYSLNEAPTLAFDHQQIVDKALLSLRKNLGQNLILQNLLPDQFTLGQLQKVYEAILGETLHRGAFQRKILALGLLKRHDKQFSGAAHKAPYLYSFG